MNTKLYVGNLPYSVTESDLRGLFAPAGEIASIAVITDRDTGRPRGFAFVEMADAAGAQKAISLVNGKTLGDRQLTVNWRSPIDLPLSRLIAFCALAESAISTKAKPRGRPVSRSVMIAMLAISPAGANNPRRSDSVTL